jgi:Uri superfamily endonuclease
VQAAEFNEEFDLLLSQQVLVGRIRQSCVAEKLAAHLAADEQQVDKRGCSEAATLSRAFQESFLLLVFRRGEVFEQSAFDESLFSRW